MIATSQDGIGFTFNWRIELYTDRKGDGDFTGIASISGSSKRKKEGLGGREKCQYLSVEMT